jgi:hypothetical protein
MVSPLVRSAASAYAADRQWSLPSGSSRKPPESFSALMTPAELRKLIGGEVMWSQLQTGRPNAQASASEALAFHATGWR